MSAAVGDAAPGSRELPSICFDPSGFPDTGSHPVAVTLWVSTRVSSRSSIARRLAPGGCEAPKVAVPTIALSWYPTHVDTASSPS